MGIKQIQAHLARAAASSTGSDFEEVTQDRRRSSRSPTQDHQDGRAQQQRPHHHAATSAAGTSAATAIIDFKRRKDGVPAKVAAIEYDPNRSARIALLHYADGEKRYILAPLPLRVGDTVMSGPTADIKPGNALALRDIPTGTIVHNIELQIGRGGQLVPLRRASAPS